MVVGRFSDPEWKGAGILLVLWPLVFCYWQLVAYWGVVRPFAIDTAPDAADPSLNEAYGFWVRGNYSFFAPGMMNRTDMNPNSSTYGFWTPPEGARSTTAAASPNKPTPPISSASLSLPTALICTPLTRACARSSPRAQSGAICASRPRACPSPRAPTSSTRSRPAL